MSLQMLHFFHPMTSLFQCYVSYVMNQVSYLHCNQRLFLLLNLLLDEYFQIARFLIKLCYEKVLILPQKVTIHPQSIVPKEVFTQWYVDIICWYAHWRQLWWVVSIYFLYTFCCHINQSDKMVKPILVMPRFW